MKRPGRWTVGKGSLVKLTEAQILFLFHFLNKLEVHDSPWFLMALIVGWDSPEGIVLSQLVMVCCISLSKVSFFSVDAFTTGYPSQGIP